MPTDSARLRDRPVKQLPDVFAITLDALQEALEPQGFHIARSRTAREIIVTDISVPVPHSWTITVNEPKEF